MIPISLVTLEQALKHRNVEDFELESMLPMLWQATNICASHIKIYEVEDIPASWLHVTLPDGLELSASMLPQLPASYSTDSPQTKQYLLIPGQLQAAILLTTGELFECRESGTAHVLSDAVIALLEDLRDPTLA